MQDSIDPIRGERGSLPAFLYGAKQGTFIGGRGFLNGVAASPEEIAPPLKVGAFGSPIPNGGEGGGALSQKQRQKYIYLFARN